MSDTEIIRFFLGYKWRAVPSVKLIPKQHIDVWKNLPNELRRVAASYVDEKHGSRITAAYNKLKHGPQVIVQNPLERARRFANSPDLTKQLARYDSFDKLGVRMLFAGSRTQPGPSDGSADSVAPFLFDDEYAVNKIFFGTMVHEAILFYLLVKMQIALYRNERINLDYSDKGVLRIVEAHGRHMAKNQMSRLRGAG